MKKNESITDLYSIQDCQYFFEIYIRTTISPIEKVVLTPQTFFVIVNPKTPPHVFTWSYHIIFFLNLSYIVCLYKILFYFDTWATKPKFWIANSRILLQYIFLKLEFIDCVCTGSEVDDANCQSVVHGFTPFLFFGTSNTLGILHVSKSTNIGA